MSQFKFGDRVRLVSMADDPSPLPAGATGTINLVNPIGQIGAIGSGERQYFEPHVQYSVQWDAPHERRSLMVICPPDVLERIA